jgi:hypothetical protein
MTAYEIRSCDWSSDVCSSDLFSRLGTSDFSRLGSLVLIGMGQVKFRRNNFQIFQKSKKAANGVKREEN